MDYKAGDKIKLNGCRMNGLEHTFTLTIAEAYPDSYDNELDSFVPFISTSGHRFESDKLITRKLTAIGRHFYSVERA